MVMSLSNQRSIFLNVGNHDALRGRGYLPIFSRILLEKVGGTYLSLCNKNSDLIFQNFFLENEVGTPYLPF